MHKLAIALLIITPAMAGADRTFDELRKENPQVCRDITQADGYPGFTDCVGRMNEDSERQLSARLIQLRRDLNTLSLKEYRTNFDRDQHAWEVYKRAHCQYTATGMTEPASGIQSTVCNVLENHKRLDTLKNEPAFP